MHEMGSKPIRILAIGSLPPPIGGATVLFQTLVDALRARPDVGLQVMDYPPVRESLKKAPGQIARQLFDLMRYIPRSDVVALFCGASGINYRVGVVSAIARRFRKPLTVRTFGGYALRADAGEVRSDQVLRALRKADLYLGETRQQVQEAREEGVKRAEWFPNHRRMPPLEQVRIVEGYPCRKFVFMSHVKANKGIKELIDAGERFGGDVRIDVYGPFMEGLTEAVFEDCRRVRYRGIVEPGDVLEVLRQYDVLLLPTYQPGEGYPGIIIEAYSVGLPVICTRWQRLEELVDERSGILVEPRSADALHDAMKRVIDDPAYFTKLRRGALELRKQFDVEVWTERFVQYCRESLEATLRRTK